MTPFEDDVTDDIVNMLWVQVYDCDDYALAREVLLALRQLDPAPARGYHVAVHDLLVDALLPEGIASNLDCGFTARTILDHAIWHGLNLPELRRHLDAWNMAHNFAPFD